MSISPCARIGVCYNVPTTSWSIDGKKALSESWSGSTTCQIHKQKTTPRQFVGCWQDHCGHSVSICSQNEKRSNKRCWTNPQHQLHAGRRKFKIFLQTSLEELDAIMQNERKKDIPHQQCSAFHKHGWTTNAPSQQVAVPEERGTPNIERRATLSDKKEKRK